MRALLRPAVFLLLLPAAACGHPLEEGLYRFGVATVIFDSCSEAPAAEQPLPDAELSLSGQAVLLEFEATGPWLPGVTGASGANALVGRFLPDRETDRFIADATFDVVREIAGLSCIAFARSSIEATVENDRAFSGSLRVDYTRRREAQPGCPQGCVVQMEFTAERADD